jgi:hypothetical protein
MKYSKNRGEASDIAGAAELVSILDSAATAMNVLKDATDSAENALRSLDGIAPMLAEEARTLALHSEDLLRKVSHAARSMLQGGGP